MKITGMERDRIASEVEAAVRRTLDREGWNPNELLKGLRVDVSDDRSAVAVVDLGVDPVAAVVGLVTRGRTKPRTDYKRIQEEVREQYAAKEALRERHRKMGLVP